MRESTTPPSPVPDSDPWPHALPVPGGVVRLSLGPGAGRPQARAGDVPLLVLGDAAQLPPIQGGGFFTDAGHAGNIVRRIAHERLEVGSAMQGHVGPHHLHAIARPRGLRRRAR